MQTKDIDELLSGSGNLCLSIIVPTHRLAPERSRDGSTLLKIVTQAEALIKSQYPESNLVHALLKNLDALINTIDFIHLKEGVGIFVSDIKSRLVRFPFPVIQKVKIGKSFDTKDLLFYKNILISYGILSISKKHIKLFSSNGENFTELTNQDFPIHFQDSYEYSRATRANSYGSGVLKEFEKDKSVIEEIRLKDLLRTAEHSMGKYIPNNTPLIVSGGSKEINDYMEITKNPKRIVGKVNGNYNFDGEQQLAQLAQSELQKHKKIQNAILLSNIKELVGKEMVAIGIEEVWKAAFRGNALQLIVEKDFECAAFIKDDGSDLKLKNPSLNKQYHFVTDAVERVIKLIREKDGNVAFMENGQLKEFDGLVLQLRYCDKS